MYVFGIQITVGIDKPVLSILNFHDNSKEVSAKHRDANYKIPKLFDQSLAHISICIKSPLSSLQVPCSV